MFEFLKTKQFRLVFSFMLGIFIILILKPNETSTIHVNANITEIESSTYQIGSKCYKFNSVAINC